MYLKFLLADSESFIQKYLFNLQVLQKLCHVAAYCITCSEYSQSILIVIGYGDVARDNGSINEGSWISKPQ